MTATLTTALIDISNPRLQENPDGSISVYLDGAKAWITVHGRDDCDALITAFINCDSLFVARQASSDMHDRVADKMLGYAAPPLSVPGPAVEAELPPETAPAEPGTSTSELEPLPRRVPVLCPSCTSGEHSCSIWVGDRACTCGDCAFEGEEP